MRSTDRWEIVVISDHHADVIVNVIRNTLAGMAEDFGYDGRTPFDLSAFGPDGTCISEYVWDGEGEEVSA